MHRDSLSPRHGLSRTRVVSGDRARSGPDHRHIEAIAGYFAEWVATVFNAQSLREHEGREAPMTDAEIRELLARALSQGAPA